MRREFMVLRRARQLALVGIGAVLLLLTVKSTPRMQHLNAAQSEAGLKKQASVVVDRALAAKEYDEQVRPFLAQHCLGCHGADKPKGDLRLDRLVADFADE